MPGITPAYAGKRQAVYHRCGAAEDHPRLCGEKWAFVLRVQLAQRITPAYAGKSGKLKKQGKFRQDHPRLCGEKPVLGFCILRPSGSPPPMRGKVTGMVPPCPDTRITPAYAGKSDAYDNLLNYT